MQISPFLNYQYKAAPNFASNERFTKVQAADGRLCEVRNSTWADRWELRWQSTARYMDEHFKDKPKVDVFSLASSDGSEAYMIAITLIETLGYEKAQKFFPIKGFDKDSKIVSYANSGKWNLIEDDLQALKKICPNINKYIKKSTKPMIIDNDKLAGKSVTYEVCDKLKNAVVFKQGDLQDEIQNIDDAGNTVVFCRNVIPYLEDLKEATSRDISCLAGLYLEEKSLFIIGGYDTSLTDIDMNLRLRDFKLADKTILPFVYEKTDPYKDTN